MITTLVFQALLVSLQATAPFERAVETPATAARHFALRLRPGQDLQREIFAFAKRRNLQAAAIVTCVGSLKAATVRFANQPAGTSLEGGPFEIVSLVGTFTRDGGHLHIALSDGKGQTLGGHLMPGSSVFTTAEIVLVELDGLAFLREKDNETTYDELRVQRR